MLIFTIDIYTYTHLYGIFIISTKIRIKKGAFEEFDFNTKKNCVRGRERVEKNCQKN